MKLKHILIFSFFYFSIFPLANASTSIAGFYPIEGSGRQVYNFNNGWRFLRGDVQHAEATDFDDAAWEVVVAPHTVQLMPAEASGCRNYQGIAWYRKRFIVPAEAKGKDVLIHFEAIMGKQKVFVNGKLVKENVGGYLPISIDITALGVKAGETCLVAVMADNTDDKTYPPGKTQFTLDFAYHGGMYRDVWMICKNKVAITDAIEARKVAGGGVFVHYNNISTKSADVFIDTELKNNGVGSKTVKLETSIVDNQEKIVKKISSNVTLKAGESKTIYQKTVVANPQLWSPESPDLYRVNILIKDGKTTIDGGTVRIGIRKTEFRGKDGFYLNGKPYGQLLGGNRHQDFAYVGNAMPNAQQWRDAKRLRDAGCLIVRTAHYPQDPAFMDACDELGLFVIVATPGWQFWNKDPKFEQLVNENTLNMIRRDRNHPSVLLWEPILNETRFPKDFALKSLQITKDEFPFPGRPGAVADLHSEGVAENYDVVYGWPTDEGKANQSIFCREFGENVDDWYAHNNNNRASRSWGEKPQLVQALSLAKSYGEMYHSTGQFIGGAQWHPFDHQRGYHPDPYWGGIFDAFRQPKYAYYMFKSQVDPKIKHGGAYASPMVFVANEITPFSDKDVTVFSNCDSVRLTAYEGKSWTKPVVKAKNDLPNTPVIFENVFDFWEAREFSYKQKNWQKVSFLVEGIIDGKVVCSEKKMPSRRSTKIRLYVDELGKKLVADGSDFIVVVAEITDDNGNVRRLAKDNVVFSVEGEAEIIGDNTIGANPRAVEWGSAPVLIRATTKSGKIKVKAHAQFEGTFAPATAEIEFESVPSPQPLNFIEQKAGVKSGSVKNKTAIILSEDEKRKLLDEVEKQQTEFGVKK
ncbi:MAG TPA: glycoside hydrolase family 2 TIM barrel-domain containing protein [Paludibacter sp.]|nr:glycoside hydrolase family 2 TIM barrel-domain containing protein [Paludibacter sp.]